MGHMTILTDRLTRITQTLVMGQDIIRDIHIICPIITLNIFTSRNTEILEAATEIY